MSARPTSLVLHIREVLCVARRWETEDPPNPATRAELKTALQVVIAELKTVTASEKTQLLGHLFESLSVAQRWETEDPPNPSTRAALQTGMQGLVAELRALAPDPQQEDVPEQPPTASSTP